MAVQFWSVMQRLSGLEKQLSGWAYISTIMKDRHASIFTNNFLKVILIRIQNYNNKIALMSKQSTKKYRHNSLVDVPFTQRTAYFKQDNVTDPYRTLPSKSTLKTLLQGQNTPFQNKYINNNENQCLRNIQDKLLGQRKNSLKKVTNNCLKENCNRNGSDYDGLEKKIEQIVEKKMKRMIESCVEKYMLKTFSDQKDFFNNTRSINSNQINARLVKIEKGYDEILRTYDNFLVIAQKIKDKVMKSQKYVKRAQIQSIVKKNDQQMNEVQQRLAKLSIDLQSLKKSDTSLCIDQQKIKPISLKYNEAQQFGIEELRIVVNTYNQNFLQIDQKLQEIYSYFT